jgi:hypothetical protein
MNSTAVLMVFLVVCFFGLAFVNYMAIRERVNIRFPGFSPYLNPIAIHLLEGLNYKVNKTHRLQHAKRPTYRVEATWFPGVVNFEESGTLVGTNCFSLSVRGSVLPLYRDRLHPTLFGYDWYRGYRLEFEKGEVLIFTPWIYPQVSRPCVFLYKGHVPMFSLVRAFIKAASSAKDVPLITV